MSFKLTLNRLLVSPLATPTTTSNLYNEVATRISIATALIVTIKYVTETLGVNKVYDQTNLTAGVNHCQAPSTYIPGITGPDPTERA
jgi:hypothetical protein